LATLTEADLVSQFRLPEEKAWAGTVARRGPSMVVLLTPKEFQSIGHFLPLAQIPAAALSYIANQLSLTAPTDVSIEPRTTYRQTSAIRTHLGVTPWGASARAIASKAVAVAVETRLDPADLVNAAIDALIRERRCSTRSYYGYSMLFDRSRTASMRSWRAQQNATHRERQFFRRTPVQH
jgi:hypothetical protein